MSSPTRATSEQVKPGSWSALLRPLRTWQRIRDEERSISLARQTLDEGLASLRQRIEAVRLLEDEAEKAAEVASIEEAVVRQEADSQELHRLSASLTKDTRAITRHVTIVATLVQVGVIALVGVLSVISSNPDHGVHMDFYAAAAAVIPVLLIAGLIEVAVVAGPPSPGWTIANFSISAVAGETAALTALGLWRSTYAVFALTVGGLIQTMIGLLLNAWAHAAMASEARLSERD